MGVLLRPGYMCAAVNCQSNTMWETDSSLRTFIINKGLRVSWLIKKNPNKQTNEQAKEKEGCVHVGIVHLPEVPRGDQTYTGQGFLLLSPGCGVLQVPCLKSLLWHASTY